ncbi:MAG: ligase-associated DNA damage response exonuclease [Chthoniobacter sp.]|nr:ligase-associated DNA damage response exonuclease [Chthoniobacter sp.]
MLVTNTERGLFCAPGNFHIDPWKPVDLAVITHAHSDHARRGSRQYVTAEPGGLALQERLGPTARIETLPFGERSLRNGVAVSFHPAGHILGSAQIRVEYRGEVCVISGDYKTEFDGISGRFEPVRCHTFITESTFALPIYRWKPQAEIFLEINDWWRENQQKERTSVLFAYSLGKAQRVLSGLDASSGPIFLHEAVRKFVDVYARAGVILPGIESANAEKIKATRGRALVIAPASADNSPWLRKFGEVSTAFASGWMQVRGPRRRRSLDRGFVLSDHADWDGLLASIEATGAECIRATHGYTAPLVRWLRERGKDADAIKTHFESKNEDVAGDGATAEAEAEPKAP